MASLDMNLISRIADAQKFIGRLPRKNAKAYPPLIDLCNDVNLAMRTYENLNEGSRTILKKLLLKNNLPYQINGTIAFKTSIKGGYAFAFFLGSLPINF